MRDAVVHVLREGFPVCGFSREVPAKWPEEHSFIGINDVNKLSDITCPHCREAARKVRAEKMMSSGCDHAHYDFRKHGRICTCGTLMVNPGD